jgi:hypothetical protein
MLLASKFVRLSNSARLGNGSSGRSFFEQSLSPFSARYRTHVNSQAITRYSKYFYSNYAKAERTKKAAVTKSDDRVDKAKERLSTIEQKIINDLKEVKRNPKTPPIPEEDRKSPISVQKRLSSIARSTAQVSTKQYVVYLARF